MKRWQAFTILYLGSAVVFYLVTWYIWGGFADKGHPPLWDVEEFFASSGLKFIIYFVVSCGLYSIAKRITFIPVWAVVLLAAFLFLVVTTIIESLMLALIGWANFFGGRSVAIGYLIAGLFFALQTLLYFYLEALKQSPTVAVEPAPEPIAPEPAMRLKVKKGEVTYFPELAEVSSISAYGNYCKVQIGEEVYLYGAGIGKFCASYSNAGFIRIHRGHVVNQDQIAALRRRGRQLEIVLTNGYVLPVGAAYRDNLTAHS